MERWRTSSRLPAIIDALTLSEKHPAVRRLAETFGGDVATVEERAVGEPAYRSRRLLFTSGGEIILHDDAVVAVVLHLAPTPAAQRGITLSEWIAGANNDATFEDLKMAIGAPRSFAGIGAPYFTLDGGYVRPIYKNNRGWNDPGNLLSITVTVEKPGLACSPEDDGCLTCSDLLVRHDGAVDIDATIDSLTAALASELITEDIHWVRLGDLRPLHSSGLMARVESQFTCIACRRIICFALFRDSPPAFGYFVLNDARQHPLGAIPPVEEWGDEARIAQERDAMHYVDHEPGAWFLVEKQGIFYLQSRYVITSMADDSALIRLNESELEAYRVGGHDAISTLSRRIHDGMPHKETSPFFERNLFRGPDDRKHRDEVGTAIVNHTWIAQQRR